MTFGWRSFFAVLGFATLGVAFLGGLLGKSGPAALGYEGFVWEAEKTIALFKPKLSILFKSKWLFIGGFAIFGDTFALAASATWVVPAFVETQHMPVEMGALIGTVMGLSQVVFLVIGGYLSDRISRIRVIRIGAVLAALSALSFVAATVWAMPTMLLLAISSLSGVAVFSGAAIFSLLGEKYPAELAPAATGYAEVFGMASTFAAPAIMGVTIDLTHSFFAAFLVFAVSELVILGLVFALSAAGARKAIAGPATGLEPIG
jgi:MFS family permease